MNHELSKGKLLNEEGNLNEAGFAYSLVKEYSRDQIIGKKWKIKEWDYYAILTDDYAIALTVADNSYMSLVSASFLDFKKPSYITKSHMEFFTFGRLHIPGTSEKGDITYSHKGYEFKFLNDGKRRLLTCTFPKFDEDKTFTCEVELKSTNESSMVIATPFNKKGHFYYNQKINCLSANGTFSIGDKKYNLKDAVGVLDWGRGVWTYKNTWYWSSLNIKDEEGYKGFNLGYGFGDTSAASENMLFYKNKAFKLDDVEFIIPMNNDKYDYLKEWKVVSKNKDIDLTFTPIIDREDCTDIGIIASLQHQVFGKFNGVIKSGKEVCKFKDAIGFAERVYNKW